MIGERDHRVIELVVAIAIGVVAGGLILSAVFWMLGLLIHVVLWAARLAVIAAAIGAVIWLAGRWRSEHRWS
jgi:hypothetical protein